MKIRPLALPRSAGRLRAAAVCLLLATALPGQAADPTPAAGPAAAGKDADAAQDDTARKAEIMSSQRWRRAIFELGEWLSAQQIYSPQEVNRIKADFNRRVAGMSS
jgi:pyruvate/2-oxoglutarate dehydrogenase complex dihydrolipoamide acyltransferase (E2) component